MIGVAAVALATVVLSPPEPASDPLDWQAPAECPSGAAVHAQLDELTTGDVDFDARGTIESTETGYRLTLSLNHGLQTQTRVAESPDCALLARAAALIIALDVDPIAAAERSFTAPSQPPLPRPLPPPSEAPPPISAPEERDPPPRDRTPQSARATPSTPRWSHGVEGAVGIGVGFLSTPSTTAGLEGVVGWTFGPLRVRLRGEHWIRSRRMLEPGAGIQAALSGAGLRTCYAPALGRVWTPVCIGADAAALHGRGVGDAVTSLTFAEPWVALALGLGIETRLSPRVTLPVRLELTVPVLRTRVHLLRGGDVVEVFVAPVAGLRLVAGAGVRSK